MKRYIFLVLLVLLFASGVVAKPFIPPPAPVGPGTELKVKTIKPVEFTVATLPSLGAADSGTLALITDGDGATDCTTGGGSDRVMCRWSGSAWANAGDGQAAGSAEVQDEAFSAGNFDGDTSHGVSQDDFYDLWHANDSGDDGTLDFEPTGDRGIANDNLVEIDDADTADNDFAKFTANGLEGRSAAEVLGDLGIDTAANLETALSLGAFASDLLGYADADAVLAGIGIDSAANLETALSLGAYASDILGAADEAALAGLLSSYIDQDVTSGSTPTLTGTNITAVASITVADNESTDESNAVLFSAGGDVDGGTFAPESDGDFTYNPSTGTVAATHFDGELEGADVDIANATAETSIASDDLILIYDTSATANRAMTRGNFVTGIGAGQAVTFDIGDDGGNDSTDVGEIATTGDTNSIFTESSPDKILIAVGNNWPTADEAVAAASQVITDNAIATVDDADAADNDFAKFTADGLEGRSYAEVRQDLGIDSAANLETSLSLGAYASDLLGTTSEANFKETVNLEIGTDVLAQQAIGITDNYLLEVDGSPNSGEAAVFTASGINGLSEAEFKTAFNMEAGTDFEAVDAEILRADTADNISADMEFQDNIPVSFGNDNDFEIAYDTDLSNDDAGDNDFAAGTFTGGGLKISTSSASDIPILLNNSGTGGVSLYVEKVFYTDSINYVGTGNFVSKLDQNAGGVSPDAGAYWVYFDDGVYTWTENQAEKRAAKLEDAQTFTGAKTFTGGLYSGDDSTAAAFRLYDGSSNYWTVTAPAMAGDYTLTLPADDGTNGEALLTNGSGVLSWGSPSASAGGSDTQIQYNSGGTTLAGDAGFVWDDTNNQITIGQADQDGSIRLYNELGATDYYHTIQTNAAQSGAITTTLPATTGTLLNNALTNTYIFVGSAGGVATGVQISGDAAMANTGALTIANDAVTMAKLDDDGNFTDWTGNWTWDTGTFLLENGLNLGSGGVVFSDDGDGQLTITGAGDGYDENLTINLDDTENTAVVGSGTGVADISYGSINLITTGHVDSGTRFIETTTDTDETVTGSSGIYINNHASAIEYTLPADPETAGGDSKIFIFRNRQANAITITPAAGDVIELDGADETAAEGIVSTGAIGEMATVVGFDDAGTDRWIVFSTNGTWDGATD